MIRIIIPFASMGVMLAACGPTPDTANEGSAATAAVSLPTPSPTPTPTRAVGLSPLSEGDMTQASLSGELACSFGDGAGRPLVIARGDVGTSAPAAALVKIGGTATRLKASGGFNAMVKGVTFTGDAMTVRITTTGPAVGGGESPALPADLMLERGEAAPIVMSGDWTCGP